MRMTEQHRDNEEIARIAIVDTREELQLRIESER